MFEIFAMAALSGMLSQHASNRAALRSAVYTPAKPVVTAAGKCECCGSREFREHNDRLICLYCRSGR